MSNSAECGANEGRKHHGERYQSKIIKFRDHKFLMVVDDSDVIWFSLDDVIRALDIPAVPSNIYDFCVSEKFIRPLSDISIGDSTSITLPGNTTFIVAEDVDQIDRRSSKPKEKQFTKLLLELLDGLTTASQSRVSENKKVENSNADEEVEQLRRENAMQKQELAKRDQEIRSAKKEAEKLKNVVQNLKFREPTQIVYIATCTRYASENKFKVGGVKSMDLLKRRLAVMNTARTPEDFLYYCSWVRCSNHQRLEQWIADVVGEHRLGPKLETYHLHYSRLKEVVEDLAERLNETDKKYRDMFDLLIRATCEEEPEIPTPLILNGAEYRNMKQECANVGVEQQRNFDAMKTEEQEQLVADSLDEYIETMIPSTPTGPSSDNLGLTRKNFENYFSLLGVKFKCHSLWPVLRDVAENKRLSIKY